MQNSSIYYENMKNYPNDSKVMSKEYLDLFNLYEFKRIINKRSLKKLIL